MKKIILLTLIISSIGVNAQSLLPIKYGIKIGGNIANISSTPNEGVKNIDHTALIGVTGGFYMEIAITDKWYINPEVVYTQKGASFDYNFTHDYDINQRDEHYTTNQIELGYIELHSIVSYKPSYNIGLNFGPSISYIVQTNYSGSEEITNIATTLVQVHEELPTSIYNYEVLDIGINLGLSYYFSDNFLIDAKLNNGFLKIGEVSQDTHSGTTIEERKVNTFELRNTGIVVSLGYLF